LSNRYLLILVLYSLASFGSLLVLGEAALLLLRRHALWIIERLRPSDGVIAHLVFRLLPSLLALVLTLLAAVPGYFHGEPMGTHELPGFWLSSLAFLGLYAIVRPIMRVLSVGLRTAATTKNWSAHAVAKATFSSFPLVDLALQEPLIVASGILRKSIFVSEPVRSLLSPRELRAALRHEAAHCRQSHNLAKLLCALAPHLTTCEVMEESLRDTIEYAADDEACTVAGDALNLASAVVILAQQAATQSSKLMYSALVDARQAASIERRVARLVLHKDCSDRSMFTQLATGYAALVALTTALSLLPAAQHAFREILELLVR
jgi:Zn-dependent protease with chaperone function